MLSRRLHTFLFADLVGYTALTELHGDEVAADLAIRLGAESARLAREHGARLLKCVGDEVMIHADNAAEAVLMGLRLSDRLSAAGLPPVHAGAHTGRAIERRGDWYGAAVNLAARVAAAARGGELLITEATAAAAGEMSDVVLDCLGPQLFKNVSGPTSVYSARLAPQSAAARTLIAVPVLSPA